MVEILFRYYPYPRGQWVMHWRNDRGEWKARQEMLDCDSLEKMCENNFGTILRKDSDNIVKMSITDIQYLPLCHDEKK